MPRAINNVASRARRKKVLKRAKGFVGGRRKLFRTAVETVKRAEAYATRDRRAKKRDFRRLWTARINAACRQCDMRYSVFMNALTKSDVGLNRKSLAEIAVRDFESFQKIVDLVKDKVTVKS